MIKVFVHGFMGKMGNVICRLLDESPDFEIAAGIDINAKSANVPFPVFNNFDNINVEAHVIIDFSTAVAVPALLDYVADKKIPLVLCTTGLDEKITALAAKTAETVPLFLSANMSIGINLLALLMKKTASILVPADFDIEIIEKHHNQKIDAPSGTALLLANAVNESLDNKYSYMYDRSKLRQKRSSDEIGIHSLRGGTIVGEHSVIFAGLDEIVEFTHIAYSKEVFGTGAVNAAKFLVNKPAGLYNMQDMLSDYV